MKDLTEHLMGTTALATVWVHSEGIGRTKFDDWWLFHGYAQHWAANQNRPQQ